MYDVTREQCSTTSQHQQHTRDPLIMTNLLQTLKEYYLFTHGILHLYASVVKFLYLLATYNNTKLTSGKMPSRQGSSMPFGTKASAINSKHSFVRRGCLLPMLGAILILVVIYCQQNQPWFDLPPLALG